MIGSSVDWRHTVHANDTSASSSRQPFAKLHVKSTQHCYVILVTSER